MIYEGLDPLTGLERRRWHPAGTDNATAENLASDLAGAATAATSAAASPWPPT